MLLKINVFIITAINSVQICYRQMSYTKYVFFPNCVRVISRSSNLCLHGKESQLTCSPFLIILLRVSVTGTLTLHVLIYFTFHASLWLGSLAWIIQSYLYSRGPFWRASAVPCCGLDSMMLRGRGQRRGEWMFQFSFYSEKWRQSADCYKLVLVN